MDHQQTKLKHRRGFSLMELLAVITVIGILLGVTFGGLVPLIRSYRLSSTSGQLGGDLAYAGQLASKLNLPVEFRFYRHSDQNSGRKENEFRSYQLLKRDAKTGYLIPLTRVFYFESGIVLHPDTQFSSLMLLGIKGAQVRDPELLFNNRKTREYEYIGFHFRPNGSTSLPKDQQWAVTLVDEGKSDKDKLPDNFRTLVINTVTGSVRTY